MKPEAVDCSCNDVACKWKCMDRVSDTGTKIPLGFIPEDVQQAFHRFIAAGFDAWVVGGALRDFLRETVPKDWDLATNATPEQVMGLFSRVIPIGVRHGTVQIHTRERNIEVTSCSAAGLEGILADLSRRDFTVNALALSFPAGLLFDPFGGQRDLLARTLRAVGDARSRFQEDPLRTLRAGRFMSAYGFHLDPETFAALKAAAPRLKEVARERIREELSKMLLGEHFAEAFREMMRGSVIQEVLPEFTKITDKTDCRADHMELVEHTIHRVQVSPYRIRVRLAALFLDLAALIRREPRMKTLDEQSRSAESAFAAGRIMQRLRSSCRLTQEVVFLVEHQLTNGLEAWTEAGVRRFLAKVGEDFLDDVMDLAYADREDRKDQGRSLEELEHLRFRISRELDRRSPLRIQDLAVNSDDVMEVLKLKPGPIVGELLRSLYEQVLENPVVNEAKFLMDFLMKEYNLKFKRPSAPEDEKQIRGG